MREATAPNPLRPTPYARKPRDIPHQDLAHLILQSILRFRVRDLGILGFRAGEFRL